MTTPRIANMGAPAEMVGVLIKRADLEKELGLVVNKELVDISSGFVANKINNADEKKKCAELIMRMSTRLKELPAIKKKMTAKLNEALSEIETPIKHAITQLTDIKNKLSQIYTEYDQAEKKAEEERLAKLLAEKQAADAVAAQEAAAAAAAIAEAEAFADSLFDETLGLPAGSSTPTQPDPAPLPATPPAIAPVNVNLKTSPTRVAGVGTLSVTKTRRVRIINPDIIPIEYRVPSERKLLDADEAGITGIPGAEFYWDYGTRSLAAKK